MVVSDMTRVRKTELTSHVVGNVWVFIEAESRLVANLLSLPSSAKWRYVVIFFGCPFSAHPSVRR